MWEKEAEAVEGDFHFMDPLSPLLRHLAAITGPGGGREGRRRILCVESQAEREEASTRRPGVELLVGPAHPLHFVTAAATAAESGHFF